ncbi:uncharacterized protein LOC113575739 [Electrophorus electricus]|uniref:uncharacterized protein LOC113575739 n=1 Tax=Electrophorus electricus TaxID=8005 RepID=UPI0015CFEB90|nr:uncharacterized protein LOC113575739 [Electrophorus electricus]
MELQYITIVVFFLGKCHGFHCLQERNILLQYLALLVFFIDKCHGHTQFIYTMKDEVQLVCDTNKWKISTKSDNFIRTGCLVKCSDGKLLTLNDFSNSTDFCTEEESDPKCSLKVRSGFFACVKALDKNFLFPFKSSHNIIDSFIVAIPNPNMTSMPEITNLVKVKEGESVPLHCSFTFTQNYERKNFVVYWIKTSGKNSTCVYSYDFEWNSIKHGHHCDVHGHLDRLSNQTIEPYTHNITIRAAMESDSGQYLCAIHVNTNNNGGNWKVISNITVSLHKAKTPDLETNKWASGSENSTAGNKSVDDPLIPLYITLPILLCLLVASVVAFMKRTAITSPESEAVQLRTQNREEEADMDCSPYDVGFGEEETDFKSKWNSSHKANNGYEESTTFLDPYSVVKIQK